MLINIAIKNLLEKYKSQIIPNGSIGQTVFPLIVINVSNKNSKIILTATPRYSNSSIKTILNELQNGYQGFKVEAYNLHGKKI